MAAQTGDRLDSHHHLWTLQRVDRGDYHWMPDGGPLREDYLPERLEPEPRDVGKYYPESREPPGERN